MTDPADRAATLAALEVRLAPLDRRPAQPLGADPIEQIGERQRVGGPHRTVPCQCSAEHRVDLDRCRRGSIDDFGRRSSRQKTAEDDERQHDGSANSSTSVPSPTGTPVGPSVELPDGPSTSSITRSVPKPMRTRPVSAAQARVYERSQRCVTVAAAVARTMK